MSQEETANMSVGELKTAALARCKVLGIRSSWVQSTRREALETFLLTDGVPTHAVVAAPTTDAATALAAALQAAMSGAMDEDRVRAIVAETAVDKTALAATIRELLTDADIVAPVHFTLRDGSSVKVDGVQHPVTAQLAALCAAGVRTWLHGPSGTGKTTAAVNVAAAAGLAIFVQPPSLTRYDVLGYIDAHGKVVDTPVSRFVRHDGPKCLILDENDAFGDGAQLACNLLLANGHCELPDGSMSINRDGSHLWIVSTANTVGKGATSAYVGRKRMDGAYLDRFDAFPFMGLHEPTERKIARGLILGCDSASEETKDSAKSAIDSSLTIRKQVAALGLDLSWSPRKTYALVTLVLSGMPTKEAAAVLLGATDKADAIMQAAAL